MKRLLKHPVIVAIIPVILSFILTVLYDMVKNRQLLSTAKNILSFIINCVTSFLQFNIKVWWIVVAMVIIIGILFILFKIGNAKNYKQSNPLWIQYQKDNIVRQHEGNRQCERKCDCRNTETACAFYRAVRLSDGG